MKKLILIVCCLAAATYRLYAYDFATICNAGQKFYYTIIDSAKKEVVVTAVNLSYHPTECLVVPSSTFYKGTTYTTTRIGYFAFSGCTTLTSVVLPNTIKHIRSGAFYDCVNLSMVNIPNSVETIGDVAFAHCHSLSPVLIPNSVQHIGKKVFYDEDDFVFKAIGLVALFTGVFLMVFNRIRVSYQKLKRNIDAAQKEE